LFFLLWRDWAIVGGVRMSAIVIANVLPAALVAEIRATIDGGPFSSGKTTAVGGAIAVKDNTILAPDSAAAERASELLTAALMAHVGFQTSTWPEAMLRPQFCRYEVGMGYGDHIDAALMGEPGAEMIRCDVAITICLNDGGDYDGGELIIDAAGVPTAWKGHAGDAIVYAANTLHRVAKVTRGVRIVAVSWLQSMVREAERRRILHDLRAVLDQLEASPASASVETLRRSYFNLVRMWA
jgi:PKHD-type hydroxylase